LKYFPFSVLLVPHLDVELRAPGFGDWRGTFRGLGVRVVGEILLLPVKVFQLLFLSGVPVSIFFTYELLVALVIPLNS